MNRGMNGGMPNLGGAMSLAARPQPQGMLIQTQSMNDVQMVAFLAATLKGDLNERITLAQDIYLEAFRRHAALEARLKEIAEERKAAQE